MQCLPLHIFPSLPSSHKSQKESFRLKKNMLVSDISLMSSISCIFYHCHHYGYIIRSLSLHYIPYSTYNKNTKNMQKKSYHLETNPQCSGSINIHRWQLMQCLPLHIFPSLPSSHKSQKESFRLKKNMLVSDISLMSSISCIFYHCHHYGYIIRSLSLHYVPYTTYKKNTKNMQVYLKKKYIYIYIMVD